MSDNIIVESGKSGRPSQYQTTNIKQDDINNELMLLTLGNFVPLKWKIDCELFSKEIKEFDADWQEYLPRKDRPNNRQALTLTCLPGTDHRINPSLAQASVAAGRRLSELEFNEKTMVYHKCESLHNLLGKWQPLGRTFLVKSNIGGHFVPHRDHPTIPRDVFRLIVFLKNCGPLDYDWLMDDKKFQIELGRVYYVNTRMTHRTISWVDDSIHLILNVGMTNENVSKVVAGLQHTH